MRGEKSGTDFYLIISSAYRFFFLVTQATPVIYYWLPRPMLANSQLKVHGDKVGKVATARNKYASFKSGIIFF